ncbi:hypothetical protein D9M68_127520 [compost metagenome]
MPRHLHGDLENITHQLLEDALFATEEAAEAPHCHPGFVGNAANRANSSPLLKSWGAAAAKDESRPLKGVSGHNRQEAAQSSGAQLLDAFLYHNDQIGEMPGSIRPGKQVVSRGESPFSRKTP